MTAYILDTETTGTSKTDQVIELAYLQCNALQQELTNYTNMESAKIAITADSVYCERFLPSCPINPRAYDVHGISRHSLLAKRPSHTVTIPNEIVYLIGHNISFDKRMLEQSNEGLKPQTEKIKYICTLNLARLLSKHHKDVNYLDHKLDTLVGHYYPAHTYELLTTHHSAKLDVIKTLLILIKLVGHLPNVDTWDKLYNMQQQVQNFASI